MVTNDLSAGDRSRQLAEKMADLKKAYRQRIIRVTMELAEIKRRYEADSMRLLRGGIQELNVSLGDVEGQSAASGATLAAPCTTCSVVCVGGI